MIDDKNIKNKYKQLKYQHLKKIYDKNLSKFPTNCKYNKQIHLPNRSKINICGFNLDDNFEVDLCYKVEHSQSCNAFCSRLAKEELYSEFMKALKDDQIRATLYKDINVLYWLYPDIKFEEFPETKKWYKSAYLWFKYKLK